MPAPHSRNIGSPNRPMPKGRAIDPIRVLRRYWKGIPIWGAVGAVIGAIAFILFARFYPLYTGDIMFEVRPGLGKADDIGTSDSISDLMVERIAATQTFLIIERSILTIAVSDRSMKETVWIEQFIEPVSQTLLVDDAVDELLEEIGTVIKRGTNLYGIRWSAHVPTDVPIMLNAISKAYMSRMKELDDESFRANADLFEDQGRHIQFRLQDLLDEIQAFIQQKGITTLDDTRHSTSMKEIQSLSENAIQTRQQLISLGQRSLQLAAKLEGTMESTMEDRLAAERDPIIVRQEQALESLEANLRALRERLDSSHPQIKEAEITVKATTDQIESKIEKIIRRNLTAELREADSANGQLIAALERTDAEIETKDAALRGLAANQSVMEGMVSTRKQLEMQRDENQRLVSSLKLMQLRQDASRVRRSTPAIEPREKSFPKLEILIPAGMLFSIAAFIGLVFLRELTDQKIRSASDVLIIPGASVAGVLPDIHEDPAGLETPELALLHSSEGVFAESCRQAWAGLSRSLQQSADQSLLLLSAAPEAGTTTVIGNFAIAAQLSGTKTVVIDCNFRRPCLASMFDFDDASSGVADMLAGSASISDCVQSTESGLDVIPAGNPANRLFQRLGSEKMKSILAELRDKYDLVIIDAPPSIVAGDALLLANLVDAIVLVVHSDRDERGLVARVLRELGESRAEVLGVMLNAAVGTVGGYFRKNYLAMVSYSDQEESGE
jgi:succinoglycan biosynthesis transport protein ExoP